MTGCTKQCEAMPECATCGRRKSPVGRSVPMEAANGYCDWECPGYAQEPRAGHLWPGELERRMAAREGRSA